MCFGGQAINIISATFGRQDRYICDNYVLGNTRNTKCKTDATQLVRFSCQNEGFCIVSGLTGKYGDPCRGTSKYLQVKYTCGPKGNIHVTWLS